MSSFDEPHSRTSSEKHSAENACGRAATDSPAATQRTWLDEEEQVLPRNNIPVVFFALLLTTFLAALDETIVATALPTIVAQLKGGKDYSWVGSAYLLAAAALSPVYGKISDIVGRKAVFYPIVVIFLIGSALCGAAQSMTWLILARALQGIGGGGILQMVNIIIGDIVPLEKRGTFGGYTGALWGIASIVGPLVGGALADHASWRWCFWINLPTGGVALALLVTNLHFNPLQHGKTFKEHVAEFDFLGLILLVGGTVCLLLGFNQSEIGWDSPATIGLLVVGGVMIILAVIWECYTNRSPIIPPRLFKTRTTSVILIAVFFHGFALFTGAFYLPVYYQVQGASATKAGAQMLPFSLGACIISFCTGFLINAIGDVRQIMWASYTMMTLGFGLMITLTEASSIATQVIFPLLAGLGLGGLFYPPIIAMQAAMPLKDMATSTAAVGLLRQLGCTVGVAIGQAIWSSELRERLAGIPVPSLDLSSSALVDNVRLVKNLQPDSLRQAVEHAYAKSISTIWIVNAPSAGLCLIFVLFLKKYSLQRKFVQADSEAQPQSSPGAGSHKDRSPHTDVQAPPAETDTSNRR